MPGNREFKQAVFFLYAGADVVNDEVTLTVCAAFVRDDDDMGQASGDGLGDQIAGAIVVTGAVVQFCAATGEKGLQVGNAAMVDVGIGGF